MILATYQCLDYLTWKNNRYTKLKEILKLSKDTNLYWCISANSLPEIIINTYTIEPNQPSLFLLFETDNVYKIDAIKWNHYVETQNESLLTEDLFNIEHEDAIEYIVTNIPYKHFEVNTTPYELANLIKDENNKYSKSFLKYRYHIIQALNAYPRINDIETLPMELSEKVDKQLLLIRKYFIAFKACLLVPLYLVGMDYLEHDITNYGDIKILSLNEATIISVGYSNIFNSYNNVEDLYEKYKDFYRIVYRNIFINKKIYPNSPCPCGSGKKYKKCCMKK